MKEKPSRRWGRIILGGLAVIVVGIIVSFATLEHWFFTVFDPGPFDSNKTPQTSRWLGRRAPLVLSDLRQSAHVEEQF